MSAVRAGAARRQSGAPGWHEVAGGLGWTVLAVLVVLVLAGCSGNGAGGSAPPANTGGATLGAAGGTVMAVSGASVTVPAGALTQDTTIRVAQDAAGAPPLPAGLAAAGSMLALTPHGTKFAEPATLRVPVTATPGANQQLRLAKAEVGGVWVVLGDSRVEGGQLVAPLDGFSYVIPVYITYAQPIVVTPPFAVTRVSVRCNGSSDCSRLPPRVDVELTVETNGGQLPAACAPDTLSVRAGAYNVVRPATRSGPTTYQVVLEGVTEFASDPRLTGLVLVDCTTAGGGRYSVQSAWIEIGRWASGGDRSSAPYPQLGAMPAPATLQVVAGQPARADVVFFGGARALSASAGDHAVIEWQRSRDAGLSWHTVAVSYQHEANPNPYGVANGLVIWRYWQVSHAFVAAAADHDTLLRARGCYVPPDPAVRPPACATGGPIRLTVVDHASLPAITRAPRSQLVRSGQTASFDVAATGAPTPTLQWQTRAANDNGVWSNVAGATAGTYTTALLGLADNGREFRVVATNAVGTAESAPVTVSISDLDVAPAITTQPSTIAVAAGGDAVFAVDARGTEPLSYQWRRDGAPVAGANGAVLRLGAVTSAQAGRYSVEVSNGAGTVTSDNATLDVTAGAPAPVAPTIVTAPAAVTVNAGNTATFAVGVGGSAPFSYQWLKDGQPIEGATLAYFSLAAATTGSAGSYSVRVTNSAGSVTSAAARLTVNDNPAPVAVTITTQPSAQVQLPGGSATFAVAATGTGPLAYQWRRNGTPVTGATGAVLTLSGLAGEQAGAYSVTVSNALGSVTSEAAVLTVVGVPSIGTQPAAASVLAGATATFSVGASGTGLRYQWTRNGVAIDGATASSYITPALTEADSGTVYAVVVYNGAGIAFSGGAVLTVSAAPTAAPDGKLSSLLNHSCAIADSGALFCWGNGVNGELGLGDGEFRPSPTRVPGLNGVLHVSAGGNSTCAVHGAARALSCWGALNDALSPTAVSTGGPVRAVAVGLTHVCLIDGTEGQNVVRCWGGNDQGQLGDGSTTDRGAPVTVQRVGSGAALSGAVALIAGNRFSCALLDNGQVHCWGQSVPFVPRTQAERVVKQLPDDSFADFTATGLVGGLFHACAIDGDSGRPLCWGFNPSGQLGDASTNSRDYAREVALTGALRLFAGASHSCAVRANDVTCWGTAFMGNGGGAQTLLAPADDGRAASLIGAPAPALAGAGGERHTCVLLADGDIKCWGLNNAGQTGTGPTTVGDGLFVGEPLSTTAGAIFWTP